MKSLVVSVFDFVYSPKIWLKAPELFDHEYLENIPDLMNLYEDGFFVHVFGGLKSANLIFDLPSSKDRGGVIKMLISIIITEGDINEDLSRKMIESIKTDLTSISGLYLILGINKAQNDLETYTKAKELILQYHETIPDEIVDLTIPTIKFFVFGATQVGKTTIVQVLQGKTPRDLLPTRNVEFTTIKMKNLSITTYDTPGQERMGSLLERWVKNQDGLVYILDATDLTEKSLFKARKSLEEVLSRPDMVKIPLLVIINKIDLATPDVISIENALKIDDYGTRDVKFFTTSAIKRKGVGGAFEWLLETVRSRISVPNIDLGLIFAQWNENVGPVVISTYPDDIFVNPERITIRGFSTSQYLFKSDQLFEKASYVLPFRQLKSKMVIIFDYIPDTTIRGGRLPLALLMLFNETMPYTIIEQFNTLAYEQLSQMKEHPGDSSRIGSDLLILYYAIKSRLDGVEGLIQANQVAEQRFQEIFEQASDGIIIIEPKTNIIVDLNNQAQSILGISRDIGIGSHISQILFFTTQEEIEEYITARINNKDVPVMEFGTGLENKIRFQLEVSTNPVRFGNQRLVQLRLKDISVDPRVFQLENEKRQLLSIINNSPAVVVSWTVGKGWPVEFISDNIGRYGYSPEDFYKGEVTFPSIIHIDDRMRLYKSVTSFNKANTDAYFHMKYRIYTKDGSVRWVEDYSYKRDVDGKVTHHQGILLDVTDENGGKNVEC